MTYVYNRQDEQGATQLDKRPERGYLFSEIYLSLPSLLRIDCHGEDCIIEFADELSTEDKSLLDTLVSNYINNV